MSENETQGANELNNPIEVLNQSSTASPWLKVVFLLFLLVGISIIFYVKTPDAKTPTSDISTDMTFGEEDETQKGKEPPKIDTWEMPPPPSSLSQQEGQKAGDVNNTSSGAEAPPKRKPVIVLHKSTPLTTQHRAMSISQSEMNSAKIDKQLDRYLSQLDVNQDNVAMNDPARLSSRLNHQNTAVSVASLLPNRDFLITKGTYIDCVLRTRIDSTVAGLTSCYLTKDVYSDNGVTRLLEKGSEVSGEYQANIQQGQARLFVLWDRVKTPFGVVVDLTSPASSSLGEGGLGGHVDNHFWQRFGGAMMLSLVDDFVGFASTGNDFNNTTGTAQDMAAEALKSTINIAPTFSKNQGARVGIYIARDIDFSKVYRLELTNGIANNTTQGHRR